VAVNTSPATQ